MAKKKIEKDSRKGIPGATKLKLWVKSGGRCEFKHCNKIVYEHDLTLSDGNFADVAHIIGAKKNGPRGNENSEKLQVDYSNLLLLCKACHKDIDIYEEQYGAEKLRRWKAEHEERIAMLTGISPEIPRSTILMFQINIGDRIIGISNESIFSAMFNMQPPKFPLDKKGIRIVENDFDIKSPDMKYWQKFGETKIKNRIRRHLEEDLEGNRPKHFSIFAIGPMPLLVYLGMVIGDTIQANIFHSNRKIEDTNKTWTWPLDSTDAFPKFSSLNLIKKQTSKVAILVALSDTINTEQYSDYIDNGYSIYRLTVEEPNIHLIQSPMQIEEFSKVYRNLLNEIQKEHGVDSEIHILPAMPASIAVECGRVLIPTKESGIFVAQIQADKRFRTVLQIL